VFDLDAGESEDDGPLVIGQVDKPALTLVTENTTAMVGDPLSVLAAETGDGVEVRFSDELTIPLRCGTIAVHADFVEWDSMHATGGIMASDVPGWCQAICASSFHGHAVDATRGRGVVRASAHVAHPTLFAKA
jgi:hypothetical protein